MLSPLKSARLAASSNAITENPRIENKATLSSVAFFIGINISYSNRQQAPVPFANSLKNGTPDPHLRIGRSPLLIN